MPKVSEYPTISGSISGSSLFLYGIDASTTPATSGKISGSSISNSGDFLVTQIFS